MSGDGFLGDVGPFSFRNVMLAMTVAIGIGLVIGIWASTPWFPWN